MMQKYNVDASGVWHKWTNDGTLVQFAFAQPGQFTTTPAEPRIDVPLNRPSTQRGLYVATALTLVGAYALCRWITRSRAGKVLVAIRDSETRVLFSGYAPANYKLFVFVVSAVLAGVAGALYAPQVGIITPAKMGVLPSIEMVVWVAAGGRGTWSGPCSAPSESIGCRAG